MQMIPVSSSNLSYVGYNNGELVIIFHNGRRYTYHNVPEHIYRNLMNAPSHGKYFAAHIKDVYRFTRG